MAVNWIDHLSAGLTAFTAALEQALVGRVQANLYVSSRRRKGLLRDLATMGLIEAI